MELWLLRNKPLIQLIYLKNEHKKIKSFQHNGNETIVEIDYHAILAIDLPNGLKAGSELNLTGKSIFKFSENKIIELTDIS